MTDPTIGPAELARARRTAILLVWVAAALLALGISPYWRINPDSALYTGMAKAIATGHGYTFSGETQWSIPPVTPLYLSLAYKAAHALNPDLSFLATFFYFHAFMAAAGMAGLLAAFFLAMEMAGPRSAVIVLALLVASRRYFSYSLDPLTDVPYCALSWAAMLYILRFDRRGGWGNGLAAAVIAVMAVMTRLLGVTLVLAAGGWFLARAIRRTGDRRRMAAGLLALAPALAAFVTEIALIMLKQGGGAFNYVDDLATGRSWGEILGRAGVDLAVVPGRLFEGVIGLESIAGLGVIFTAFLGWGAVALWRKGVRLAPVYFVCYLLFVASGEDVLPRYVTPLLPFVYLFGMEAFEAVAAWAGRPSPGGQRVRQVRTAAAVVMAIVMAINLVYVGRQIGWRFSSDFYASYRNAHWKDYFALSDALAGEGNRGRVMAYEWRVISALSGRQAAGPPYHPERIYRPGSDETARYVADRNIDEIVVDPRDEESAEFFERFIAGNPAAWQKAASFGTLTVYRRAGDG